VERGKETTNWLPMGLWKVANELLEPVTTISGIVRHVGAALEHRIILCYDTVLDRPIDSAVLSGMGGCPGTGTRARSGAISRRPQHRTATEKEQGHQ
jgi:hypothetical protein